MFKFILSFIKFSVSLNRSTRGSAGPRAKFVQNMEDMSYPHDSIGDLCSSCFYQSENVVAPWLLGEAQAGLRRASQKFHLPTWLFSGARAMERGAAAKSPEALSRGGA
ncbi:MAG TPA: hypothetical protein VK446_01670 [Methylocystis sp.]|nr:hypothetical protein [Methylocystis sp.]